jgi:hypothetical protein
MFVAADALTMKVREGGRVVNAVMLLPTGVNAGGHREVLGLRVATSETDAWAGSVWSPPTPAPGSRTPSRPTCPAPRGTLPHPLRGQPDGCHRRVCGQPSWTMHLVYDQPDAAAVNA